MGYCGIDCKKCRNYVPIELRTNKKDEEKSNFITIGYSDSEEIECYGCEYNENIDVSKDCLDFCSWCSKRSCAIKNNVNSCKECPDFPCEEYPKKTFKNFIKNLFVKNK